MIFGGPPKPPGMAAAPLSTGSALYMYQLAAPGAGRGDLVSSVGQFL